MTVFRPQKGSWIMTPNHVLPLCPHINFGHSQPPRKIIPKCPFGQKCLQWCRSKFTEPGGKRNPNLNFLVRRFSSGVGVFHVNGWGPKSSIRPSKPGKSTFLGGISRDFAGISRRRPRSLRKKVWVQFSFPILSRDFGNILSISQEKTAKHGVH